MCGSDDNLEDFFFGVFFCNKKNDFHCNFNPNTSLWEKNIHEHWQPEKEVIRFTEPLMWSHSPMMHTDWVSAGDADGSFPKWIATKGSTKWHGTFYHWDAGHSRMDPVRMFITYTEASHSGE